MGLYLLKFPARRLLQPLARAFGWVHPDVLSYLATAVTVGTAACYVYAARAPVLLLAAVVLTLVRMGLNTLDGVIAIQRSRFSLKGEIVNALPDRYSDILLIGGIAVSGLCGPVWGMLGLASMLLVSYSGMLGKALGVQWQHHGPLGKVERLILIMVFSLVQFFHLRAGAGPWMIFGLPLSPLEFTMALFVVLGQVTVFNRTRGMLREIARLEWRENGGGGRSRGRFLVTYDSNTGNTKKVACAMAECLHADLRPIGESGDIRPYDMVLIGSPVIRGKPTPKVLEFARDEGDLDRYALFFTYGAPVWGPIAARKARESFALAAGAEPAATFACKGYHQKFKTYKGRPNDDDLLSAFLFAMKLATATGTSK